jgi:putative endonuclease
VVGHDRHRIALRVTMPGTRTDRQIAGAAAEDAACAHLLAAGCQLLARNVGFRVGELDLVMREVNTIVFVEVRMRRDDRFGGAAASIDAGKRRKVARAAQAWLAAHPRMAQAACRFDIVAVTNDADGPRCVWLRSAFTMDDV